MSSVFDLAELGQMWQKYRPRLLSMLERRIDPALRPRLGADDVLSEAFLVAQGRWNSYRAGSPMTPYAWFYRLALDALIEAWRREHRGCRDLHRNLPYPDRSSVQLGLKIVSPGTKPSEAFARQELRDQVKQALDLLPEQRRQILWMRHVDELSIAEICSVLEMHERTVFRELKRAVQQLTAVWRQIHPEGEQP
jgi:RNA polymerase sigma factor (sigma-70 family)